MNELYSTIENDSKANYKQLNFPTIAGEKIKEVQQTGHNLVVIVDIKILKTGLHQIIISSDEASKKYADAVEHAINELLSDLGSENNTIAGCIIDLSNGTIHPTDFNSNKTRMFFYNYFLKLLEENN